MTDLADDDPRIDELFALTPDEFTAARNALVKDLRREERRELAKDVGALRRPTAAAWAVNQTVRRHGDRFARLLEAGDAVRTAQRRALSGVRRGGMREATRNRRDLIEELAGHAVALLDAQGAAGDSHRGDIVATFDAASADAGTAAVVAAGRLSQALPVSSGFGALDGLSVLAAAEPEPAPHEDVTADDDGDTAVADPDEQARQEEVARTRRAAIRAVEDARRRLNDAQGTAERAAAEADRAEARWTTADRAATTAEDKARRLRGEAAELADRLERARSRARDADGDAGEATDELAARERALQALDDGPSS